MKEEEKDKLIIATKANTRDLAIKLIEDLAASELREHKEPKRKGTPRGEPIGISLMKRKAAVLCVGHPVLFSLKDIAERCKTTEGTVKVWRVQEDFIELVRSSTAMVGAALAHSIEWYISQTAIPQAWPSKDVPDAIEPIQFFKFSGAGEIESLIHCLEIMVLLNPEVYEPYIPYLKRRIDAGSMSHVFIAQRLYRAARVHNLKTLRIHEIDFLETSKSFIAYELKLLIELVLSYETYDYTSEAKKANTEMARETADRIKTVVFELLDRLA